METLEEYQVLFCFGASLYSRRGRWFWSTSVDSVSCGHCVPRVEVKDSTKSLMMLLIVWEVFAFGEVYLGCSLISSPFQFPTKRCLSPYPYESTVDVSALLELQFHQMPLDLNFPRRVRLLETS